MQHIVIDARIRQSSTGRYIDRLLEHLQKIDSKHRYTVLLAPKDGWQPSSKRFTAKHIRTPIFSFNPLQQLVLSWQLYQLRPNLVHFGMTGHAPLFYFGHQITTTHDLTMFKYTRRGRLPRSVHWVRMRAYHLLVWVGHRMAKTIIVPTEYVRDAVAKYHLFTNRKIVVTYEASEPPLQVKPVRPDYAPDEYIMYVGSSFPHKNLRRLIRALDILNNDYPNLRLLLVGKQELHGKRLQKWVKDRGIQNVVFTGFVSDTELKWLYEHCKAYIFPSLSEGFGLPGLEAMTYGAPVISSNATCLPEVYGEAAQYFDPEKTEEIAQAINKVLKSEKLRNELVAKGYKQIKKYSWTKMAEQTLSVYEDVLPK